MARGRRCHTFLEALGGTYSPIDFNGFSVRLCFCCGKELLNTALWGALFFVSEQLLAKPLVSKWKHTFSSHQDVKLYLNLASFLSLFAVAEILIDLRIWLLNLVLTLQILEGLPEPAGALTLEQIISPSSGTGLLAAWHRLMSGIGCQPSSCHAGGLSPRAAAAHLPATGSGSDICSWSQLWAAQRCQSPSASVLDPAARKGFWCQTTA